MADSKTRNFVGSGKEKVFDNWGSVINISISKEKLEKCKLSDKGYYYITVAKKQSMDERKNTHMVYENSYEKKETTADSWKDELFA